MSLKSCTVFLFASSFVCCAMAQETQTDANQDLHQIMTNVAVIEEMCEKCSIELLPTTEDCDYARDFYIRCVNARNELRTAEYWYKLGVLSKTKALTDGMDELLVERIMGQLEVQSTVVDGASYRKMISEARKKMQAFTDCYEEINELSFYQYQNFLFGATNCINQIREAENAFGKTESTREIVKELDGALFEDDYSSFLTSLGELRVEAYNSNNGAKKWRRMISKGEHKDPIDENVGKLMVCYTDDVAATREKEIDAHINNTEELDDAQKALYQELVVMNRRAATVSEALSKINHILEINSQSSSGTLGKTYIKLNEQCGSINLTLAPREELPADIRVESFKVSEKVSKDDTSWVGPVKALDQRLTKLSDALLNPPKMGVMEMKGSITCDVTTIKATEKFKAKFTAMYQYQPRTWVGFVPSDVPHGLEGVNHANKTRNKARFLFKKEAGELQFMAPREPGKYDLRMNDLYTGREIASHSLEVLPADPEKLKADIEREARIKAAREAKKKKPEGGEAEDKEEEKAEDKKEEDK